MIPIVQDLKPLLDDYGHLTVSDLALLSLVSEGVDHRSALVQASGMQERTVYRRMDALSSKPRWRDGKISGNSTCFHHWCKAGDTRMNRDCSTCSQLKDTICYGLLLRKLPETKTLLATIRPIALHL